MQSLEHWRERLFAASRHPRARAAYIGLAALGIAIVSFVLVFQWSWLRAPLERRYSASTGRPVAIAELDGHWEGGPRLRARGVVVGGADGNEAIFSAREITAHVAPWPLLRARVELLELGLVGAVINLERDRSGAGNWTAEDQGATRDAAASPKRAEPRWKTMKIARLSLSDVVLSLTDDVTETELRARVDSIPKTSEPSPWFTNVEVTGRYRKTRFTGHAVTGAVVTLRDTGIPFPFKASVQIARTAIQLEGGMADLLGDTSFDVLLRIAGPSLSTLYPTLPLALPSTPPYRLQGRLRLQESSYRLDDIVGRIGRSDIRGAGDFAAGRGRPMLRAKLSSDHFALADLGALLGVPQSEAERQGAIRVLPDSSFDLPRMSAMNADVSFEARKLVVRPELPFENLSMRIELIDGVLHLRPLKFGAAGGEMVSTIVLDARQRPLTAEAAMDIRRIEFARLFPTLDRGRLSAGELGAQIRLRGRGQSVADLLSTSSGTVAAAMGAGRISHAVLAAASLDGGKLLPLLVRGDEAVELRCAAVSMVVEDGVARTQLMVFDTETVRVDGSGAIDLAAERFGLVLDVQPKQPSILSVRAPLHVQGTFHHPKFSVGAGALIRGGAAIALGVVNPLAALLPLIETGPGDDANCLQVLAPVAPALKQATQKSKQPPPLPAKKSRERTVSN